MSHILNTYLPKHCCLLFLYSTARFWDQFQGCTADAACQSCYEGEKTSHVRQRLKQVSCLNLCLPVKTYGNKLSLFFSLPLCCWYRLNGIRLYVYLQKTWSFGPALFLSKRLIIWFHLNISTVSTSVLRVARTNVKLMKGKKNGFGVGITLPLERTNPSCAHTQRDSYPAVCINTNKLCAIRWN